MNANDVIRETFKLYAANRIGLAFNGGKDCCVVLDLVYRLFPNELQQLLIVHFAHTDEFEEVTHFIESTRNRYNLQNLICISDSIKDGLKKVIADHGIEAFITGRRSTDPYPETQHFTPSSVGWPVCMRVAPILNWTYHDVWAYLRTNRVPYPILCKWRRRFAFFYFFTNKLPDDQGYTSLGTKSTTIPNPKLKCVDGTYLCAHKLVDESDERLSRVSQ